MIVFILFYNYFVMAQVPHGNAKLITKDLERDYIGLKGDSFVVLPEIDTDSAKFVDDLPDNRFGGLKFAHKFHTNITQKNSGVHYNINDGVRVWKVCIRSNGAYSLNIYFSKFNIPNGSSLFLYNPDRTVVLGPFTRENQPQGGAFSVAPVMGDELIVEYQEPDSVAFLGEIEISEINHDYRGQLSTLISGVTSALPCIPDVSCNQELDKISRSTCLIIVNGDTYCTASLINNTAKDGKPYLLTASHCLNNLIENGSKIVAFFNYESPRCDAQIHGSKSFTLSGGICKALSSEIDFALVELNDTPAKDFRPWFAGWSLNELSLDRSPFFCIHHPNGSLKKFCIEMDSVIKMDWPYPGTRIMPNNHWYVSHWDNGHTWDGSSGAALFDNKFRIVGGLSGGSSGGVFGCQSYTMGDFFFRMDKAWDQYPEPFRQLKHWLDPFSGDSSSTITELEGFDPYESNSAHRISNIKDLDSIGRISVNGGFGSIFGHNNLHTANYAEHFETADSSLLLGVYLVVDKGVYDASAPVYLTVFSGGDTPGSLIFKELLKITSFNNYGNIVHESKTILDNNELYVRFTNPISVGKDFYVGYEIQYPIIDKCYEFSLFGAIRSIEFNSAFFKQKNRWNSFECHPTNPVSSSLWIEPIIIKDSIIGKIYKVEINKPYIFWEKEKSAISINFPSTWCETSFIEIYNMMGQMIRYEKIQPPKAVVQIGEKHSGVLMIRIRNGVDVYTTKVLIK